MYYVGFSTATIVASLILFQGFNTDNPTNTISLLIGFIVTFLGIHLLELSRKPAAAAANSLEGGLINPRLSLQGDGWTDAPAHARSPSLSSNGHARRGSRSSLYRAQTHTLFSAFDDGGADGEAVGLRRLSEEGEDDELEAATERTRLRAEERRSRSHSHSPRGSQTDLRRS